MCSVMSHTLVMWPWLGTEINMVDIAHLEACGAPFNKLNGSFSFDGSDGSIHIFGHNIPSVKKTTGHVLAVAWVTFHHLDVKHQTLVTNSFTTSIH